MPTLEIVEAPPRRLLAVTHRGPYPEIGEAFGRLHDLLCEHGLLAAGGELVAVYYDDPDAVARADLRAHAGITVDAAAPCPPGLEAIGLAGGRHAVVRVVGPYSNLYPAYVWLHDAGLTGAAATAGDGPAFEVYRNDPSDTAPEDLVTDIFVPLA